MNNDVCDANTEYVLATGDRLKQMFLQGLAIAEGQKEEDPSKPKEKEQCEEE